MKSIIKSAWNVLFALILSSSTLLFGQKVTLSPRVFVIDASRPYVYLVTEHIGTREPRREGEPKRGIWFWLVNNCKVPIIVSTFGVPPGSPEAEIGVMDDVVSNPRPVLSMVSWSPLDIERSPMPEVLLPSNPKDAQKKPQGKMPGEAEPNTSDLVPYGYMFDVRSSTIILPGKKILFSLPISHISKSWHVEIPFRFALGSSRGYRQPYNYIAIFWEDLPETYRKAYNNSSSK